MFELNVHENIYVKGAEAWLSTRTFSKPEECIAALREDKREIWCTTLSPTAELLTRTNIKALPKHLAIIMGREVDGVSKEFLDASTKHVFLPMFGFTESFNLSVATALVIHTLFDICPEMRGDMTDTEKAQVREKWFDALGRTQYHKEQYAKWLNKHEEIEHMSDLRRGNVIARVSKKVKNKMNRKVRERNLEVAARDDNSEQ